jgi:hypothetical protein
VLTSNLLGSREAGDRQTEAAAAAVDMIGVATPASIDPDCMSAVVTGEGLDVSVYGHALTVSGVGP